MSLPLFVRENTVLPIGNVIEKPDYDYTEDVTFHVFDLSGEATVQTTVQAASGNHKLDLSLTKEGEHLVVDSKGARNWSLILRGLTSVHTVENGSWTTVPDGVKVIPEKGQASIRVVL